MENSAGTQNVIIPGDSFNGATATSPWRTPSLIDQYELDTGLLQWGHGDFAVENLDAQFACAVHW